MIKIITILALFYFLASSALPEVDGLFYNHGEDNGESPQQLPLRPSETKPVNQRIERQAKPCARQKAAKLNNSPDESIRWAPILPFELSSETRLVHSNNKLEPINNENNEVTLEDDLININIDDDEINSKNHPNHRHGSSKVQVNEDAVIKPIVPAERLQEVQKQHQEINNSDHENKDLERSFKDDIENEDLDKSSKDNIENLSKQSEAVPINHDGTQKQGGQHNMEKQGNDNDNADVNSRKLTSSNVLVGNNNELDNEKNLKKGQQELGKNCSPYFDAQNTRRLLTDTDNTVSKPQEVPSIEQTNRNAPQKTDFLLQKPNNGFQTVQNKNAEENNNDNQDIDQQRSYPGYFGFKIRDPTQGVGVTQLSDSGVNLLQHDRVCYACSSINNPTCQYPSRKTTIKYCRRGHDSCVTKTFQHGKNPEIVIRDCAKSCDDAGIVEPQYKSCKVCDSDLCNNELVNGAFTINNQNLMFTIFAMVIIRYSI